MHCNLQGPAASTVFAGGWLIAASALLRPSNTVMQVTEVRERLKARAQMGSEEQQEQFQLNIAYIYAATSAVLCIGLVNGVDPVWLQQAH